MVGKLRQGGSNTVNLARIALATGAGLLTVGIAAETATSMAYVGGAFVAAGVFLGPAAPLGGVAGLIIHDLFRGAFGYSTLVVSAWIIVFAGSVVWLAGPVSPTSRRLGLQSTHRAARTDIGMVMIAGMYATAFAGWLVTLLGWQRFYTAAFEFLPGVIVALGVCLLVLIFMRGVRRLGPLRDRHDIPHSPSFEPVGPERDRSAKRTGAAAVGAFTIGVVWLGGALALDLFVHDLGLFATVGQFRAFITGFLGTSSPIAAGGTSLLVGVYRYGKLAVLFSAPVAILALWGWDTYQDQIRSSIGRKISMIGGVSTR